MPDIAEVFSPSLGYELLFRKPGSEADPFETIQALTNNMPDRLGMLRKAGGDHATGYELFQDGIQVEVSGADAHDTFLLRLKVSLTGIQASDNWLKLEEKAQSLLYEMAANWKTSGPWGSTQVYQALQNQSTTGALPANFPHNRWAGSTSEPNPSPYGWLWLMDEGQRPVVEGVDVWLRSLAVLVPEERCDKVNQVFLAPLNQGLARIELYLHKGIHHARLQTSTHDRLDQARRTLQDSMNSALALTDGKPAHAPRDLDHISTNLLRFLTQVSSLEILLNSLQTNCQAFRDHLELVKMDIPLYHKEMHQLDWHIEQLSADIRNSRAVMDSTYSFQEIHRSMENARMERSTFLMGVAAAVLAGVAIFNSFVDIWNLVLEGSEMIGPSPWLRFSLGLVAGVSFPLAAAWLVEKKIARGVVSASVGVLSVLMAIIATMLVNL